MYVPSTDPGSIDDKDVMGVCVPPLEYYYGLKQYGSRGTVEVKQEEWDIVVYEARKMISMMAKGNPNVLMCLWLEPEHVITTTPAWDLVVASRSLFVGKHVYWSFSGYAYGQLHRMTHYAFEGYMGAKRKALVEKVGYDCKNAAHLVRLLRMGCEFLAEGRLYVKREDAQQLLEIKRGEWTLDAVQREARRLFDRTDEAYDRSTLPAAVDMDKINALCVEVIRTALESRKGDTP